MHVYRGHMGDDPYGIPTCLIVTTETLYHRDDALIYIAYEMLIWAAPIPADRWHCHLWLLPWADRHAS